MTPAAPTLRADDRCPLCFRGGMRRGDGSVAPHRRLSKRPEGGAEFVWCKAPEMLLANRAGGRAG